jgi:hypothetical protein
VLSALSGTVMAALIMVIESPIGSRWKAVREELIFEQAQHDSRPLRLRPTPSHSSCRICRAVKHGRILGTDRLVSMSSLTCQATSGGYP